MSTSLNNLTSLCSARFIPGLSCCQQHHVHPPLTSCLDLSLSQQANHNLVGVIASTVQSTSSLKERQFSCPGGLDCGPGPVCTPATCDLPGCADADICLEIVQKRQFGCPDGLHCGPGPACTIYTCDFPGCADAEVCQESNKIKKREADTDMARPDCDICVVGPDGTVACGCRTDGPPKLEQREPTKLCPLFCVITADGQEICGCAAEDYLKSHPGSTLGVGGSPSR